MKLEEGEVLAPTMFKLEHRRPDQYGNTPPAGHVECVCCNHKYPLRDLMGGELEETFCPNCKQRPEDLWGPHCVQPHFSGRLFTTKGGDQDVDQQEKAT